MNKMYGDPGRSEDAPPPPTSGRGRLPRRELRLRAVEPGGRRRRPGTAQRARQADRALDAVPRGNKSRAGAARYALEAAYQIAKMKKSVGRRRRTDLVQDDDRRLGVLQVVSAATAGAGRQAGADHRERRAVLGLRRRGRLHARRRADPRRSFDYATGHHHYCRQRRSTSTEGASTRTSAKPKRSGQADALEHIAHRVRVVRVGAGGDRRGSGRSTTRSARASTSSSPQATSRRSKRRSSRSWRQRSRRARRGGQGDKADQIRQQIDDTKDQVRSKWRAKKDQYIDVCNQKMVGKLRDRRAHRAQVQREERRGAERDRAPRVLHRLSRRRQDARVRDEDTPDPTDPNSEARSTSNGEFLQWRSGVVVDAAAERAARAAPGGAVRQRRNARSCERASGQSPSAARWRRVVCAVAVGRVACGGERAAPAKTRGERAGGGRGGRADRRPQGQQVGVIGGPRVGAPS